MPLRLGDRLATTDKEKAILLRECAAPKYTRATEQNFQMLDRFLNLSAWLARRDPASPPSNSLAHQIYISASVPRRYPAPGPNGIPYKAYQLLPEELRRALGMIMGTILEGSSVLSRRKFDDSSQGKGTRQMST